MKNDSINLTVTDLDEQSKIEAIARHFEVKVEDIETTTYDHYGLTVYKVDGEEYAVGTDEEADAAVADYIKDSAWSFNADFLASQTDLPEEVYRAMQDKCEDSNDAVSKLIEKTCGWDDFVAEAIRYDGRGHFLSGYDGEEIEVADETDHKVAFYAYKQ